MISGNESSVAASEIYKMQFYRQQPGDLGIDDVPIGEKQDPEGTVSKALLGYFNNKHISPAQRPHHARVVTLDGSKTLLTIMASGPQTVEKV